MKNDNEKKNECRSCAFENPKPCVTAVCMRDNKILVARRNEEPFKDAWDFIGGYIQKDETPEQALRREIKEELGVESKLTYIDTFTGTASFEGNHYPIISLLYFAELEGNIVLNEENSEVAWIPLHELTTIAFDSNEKILAYLKKRFIYDIDNIKALIAQLDSTALVNEASLYKAMLEGYVSIEKNEEEKVVGMGWIFPRQTLLRKQAVIEDMIVDEKYRGKGIGEKILKDLIRWAKEQGVEVIELTTNPKRVAANALYQKVGFSLHETNHYLLKL